MIGVGKVGGVEEGGIGGSRICNKGGVRIEVNY